MFAPAQEQWRDWAAKHRAHAAQMKPDRDRWCRKHGYEIEKLPHPETPQEPTD